MKLRIRSLATKETLRIEAPDPSSLHGLKTLVAGALSSSSSSSSSYSISPESIRLSLNRKDELLPSSPHDTLHSLGLTSGDLVYFSLSLDSETLTPSPVPAPAPAPGATLKRSDLVPAPPVEKPSAMDHTPVSLQAQTLTLSSSSAPATKAAAKSSNLAQEPPLDNPSRIAAESSPPQLAEAVQQDDRMEVDVDPVVVGKSLSVPCFLNRVMQAEKGEVEGILGRLVITIQAAFLESGFVVSDGSGGDGSRLPEGWASKAANLFVQYTVPELVGGLDERDAKVAILRFSTIGSYATIYGFLSGDHPDVYRVCFDMSKLAPLLSSSMDSLSEREEKEVFGLWKIVKDGLSLPLLVDICQKNALPSPTCFMRLPTDLKIKVLEFLSGIDVAKLECTCSEFRYLSSNDDLWKQKFLEEFGLVVERRLVGRSWKDEYVKYWVRKKIAKKRNERKNAFHCSTMMGSFSVFGSSAPRGLRLGLRHLPTPWNFSPDCNLGGNDDDFFG